MTAQFVIEGRGELDDELSHAMMQLAKYQQAIIIYDQLETLFGAGESPIGGTEYADCVAGKDFWANKFAELLERDDPEGYASQPALIDAIEYADTYRQQAFVFGVFCPQRAALLKRDGPWPS